MAAGPLYFSLADNLDRLWPDSILPRPPLDVLSGVWLEPFKITTSPSFIIQSGFLFESSCELGLPNLEFLRIVIGAAGTETTCMFQVEVGADVRAQLIEVPVAIRIGNGFLRPATEVVDSNGNVTGYDIDHAAEHVDVTIASATITVGADGRISVQADAGIRLPLCSIGDTGILLEGIIEFDLDPANPSLNIQEARLVLPADSILPQGTSLIVQNGQLDSTGFSGSFAVDLPLQYDAARRVFEYTSTTAAAESSSLVGFPGGIRHVALLFEQNRLTGSDIRGALLVPYFEQPVDVLVNIEPSGKFSITLSGSGDSGVILTKEELLAITLKSLSVSTLDDAPALTISGGLEPLLMSSDGLQWPRLDVTDLYIDSTGKFSIKEAWLDLKELATLDLWGFHFELRRIGIGSEVADDKLWINLSGGLRLIEQIPLALDVEGFRLTWPRTLLEGVTAPLSLSDIQDVASQIEVQFAGIYLFFGVPDAVEFEGLIRFFKDAQIVGFAGDMALRVPASGFGAEAGLLIGLSFEPAFPFLYVYFGVDLPAGIPLGQSGLALKGAQGMFGLNVGPDKDPDQNWYYDWYKRGPIVGAHPTNKWKPLQNALALGVGVTITTTDGYVKGTRGLIVLAIPGPILIIEGRALILNGLQPNAEPPLRALAVFDGGAKTVQFNVEAEATLVADLLKAYGMLEAFFDFNDLTNWHLYLGQDTPRSRRIRADILKLDNNFLFKADAYLMIDMVGTETLRSRIGASIGFEPNVPDIDPLEVDFAAVLKGDGEVTARPEQFSGELDLSAHIKLSALGVSLRLSAEAGFLTEGPKPLKVGAHVKVKADMPSPLDPVEATLEFEWQSPDPPKVESPLAEIDVHSRLAPPRTEYTSDGVPRVITIHEFAEVDRQWEVPAKLSRQVEADSQPIICFKQKMNSTVESFARHPDGESHHYDVGLFEFYPSLTTLKLYEHLKQDNDHWANNDTDWTLIASTEESDHKPLPGVWLVESEPESPQAPSPRKVQLWTDNPLSSSAAALGSGYKLLRGAIEPGKSLAERILADYPDLMECEYTKAKPVCVAFDAATDITIERGESWEYKDLLFISRHKTAHLQTVGGSAPVSPNLVGSIVDTIRSVGSRIVDTVLRRPAPHKCLFINGYIDIHFRQRVKHVRIVLCQPSKMPETAIRIGVKTKRGIRTEAELAASGQDRKSITLEDIRRCNVPVASTLAVSDQEWVLEADEGFDCINIIRLDKFAIREICYTTVAEVDRSRLALEQCRNNADVPVDGQTLRPGAYYRLDVMTRVRGELNDDDLPFDPDSTLGRMLVPAYEALAEKLAEDVLPSNYHQTCFFQTEAPPTNLRPYVKWCSPQEQSERFFRGDNISLRFLRSNLEAMFRSPFTLTARVKDSNGRQAEGFATQWRRATSTTLFPEERVWENHRADLNWPDRPIAYDNVLLVRSTAALSPGSRYVLEIVGRASGPNRTELVLFSSTFTTSRFKSFKNLVNSFKREQSIENKRSSIPDLTELRTSTRFLARARYDFEHAEIDFRFGTLKIVREGFELTGREALEQARLERREKTAAHDAKFSQLVEEVADLYYRPVEERLELYLVTIPASKKVIALWIRSPETLDIRLAVTENPEQANSPVVDQVGRTMITLQQTQPTERSRPISVVSNSDSTQLLIVSTSGRLDSGTYILTLTYHRDYGDELRSIDHRYDRPIESAADGSTEIETHLKFRI